MMRVQMDAKKVDCVQCCLALSNLYARMPNARMRNDTFTRAAIGFERFLCFLNTNINPYFPREAFACSFVWVHFGEWKCKQLFCLVHDSLQRTIFLPISFTSNHWDCPRYPWPRLESVFSTDSSVCDVLWSRKPFHPRVRLDSIPEEDSGQAPDAQDHAHHMALVPRCFSSRAKSPRSTPRALSRLGRIARHIMFYVNTSFQFGLGCCALGQTSPADLGGMTENMKYDLWVLQLASSLVSPKEPRPQELASRVLHLGDKLRLLPCEMVQLLRLFLESRPDAPFTGISMDELQRFSTELATLPKCTMRIINGLDRGAVSLLWDSKEACLLCGHEFTFARKAVKLSCGHVFHADSKCSGIAQWLIRFCCPLCVLVGQIHRGLPKLKTTLELEAALASPSTPDVPSDIPSVVKSWVSTSRQQLSKKRARDALDTGPVRCRPVNFELTASDGRDGRDDAIALRTRAQQINHDTMDCATVLSTLCKRPKMLPDSEAQSASQDLAVAGPL
jgi:hypothetical protein